MAKRGRGVVGSRPGPKGASPEAGSDAAAEDQGGGSRPEPVVGWPAWARRIATGVLLFHFAALLAGALGVPPSSELERAIADGFSPYFDLIDLGYSYRFYAEPPPTPVARATIKYGDGRADETIRLPGRDVPGPRMRHQRQLALANALSNDVQEARRRFKDPGRSPLARAYARHLCRTRPGARSVTLHLEQHLIPEPGQVRQALESPGSPTFDLFDDRLFTTPEWVGDFPCDDF